MWIRLRGSSKYGRVSSLVAGAELAPGQVRVDARGEQWLWRIAARLGRREQVLGQVAGLAREPVGEQRSGDGPSRDAQPVAAEGTVDVGRELAEEAHVVPGHREAATPRVLERHVGQHGEPPREGLLVA